ncbi:MAG: hypothetical protein JW969_20370 [Spirochaetales bacterium]|nr:hypothetical protein [Spirochaetales bacterium]
MSGYKVVDFIKGLSILLIIGIFLFSCGYFDLNDPLIGTRDNPDVPDVTPEPTNTPTDSPTPIDTPTDSPTPLDTPTNSPTPLDTPTNSPIPTSVPDTQAPTPGNTFFANNVQSNSITVNWNPGTDNKTIVNNLQYKLVISLDAATIDTSAEVMAITAPDIVLDWTKGADTTYIETATGLSSATTYYFALAVRDEAGNIALYPLLSVTTDP